MSSPNLNESGVILVDKPQEWTSHDVVNCIRRRFRIKKVGHCGTLDPNATGLLVVVFGYATKLSAKFSPQDKVYCGTMRLGITTDSQDAKGEIIAENDPCGVTLEQLREAAREFIGDIEQIPPMVSAVKKDGQPLYKLARKGQEVEREPRHIHVDRLEFSDFTPPDANLEIACSKGTYVRTICHDIGQKLGCGAHLLQLRRLKSGGFDIKDAYTMDTIKSWEKDDLMAHKIHLDELLEYV